LLTCWTKGLWKAFSRKLGAFDHLSFHCRDSLQLHELAVMDLKEARGAFELRYWLYLRSSNTEVHRFVRAAPLSSQLERRPAPPKWMGNRRKCLWNYRILTRALAIELAPIRVNAVSPGIVRTNLWQNMSSVESGSSYSGRGQASAVGRVGEDHGHCTKPYLFLMEENLALARPL